MSKLKSQAAKEQKEGRDNYSHYSRALASDSPHFTLSELDAARERREYLYS
jgi:hypothetical protein